MVGKCMQIDIEYPAEKHDECMELSGLDYADSSATYGPCAIIDLELPSPSVN